MSFRQKTFILVLMMALVAPIFLAPYASASIVNEIGSAGWKTLQTAGMAPLDAASSKTPTQVVAIIVKAMMGLLSVVFIVLIFSAGLIWMTSAGNDEKLQKAIGIAMFAVIGLVIAIAGYVIAYVVFDIILEAGGFGSIFAPPAPCPPGGSC